jgi:hypothetical protein
MHRLTKSVGAYSVARAVTWNIPGSYIPEGGMVFQVVDVADGETKNVVITR